MVACLTISDHWRRYDLMLIVCGFSWCAGWTPSLFTTLGQIRFSDLVARDVSELLTHRVRRKIISTLTCCIAIAGVSHVAATNPSLAKSIVGSCFKFMATGIAMTVDDLLFGIDSEFSEIARCPNATTEPSAFTAAVIPLRQIAPTSLDQRLLPERLHEIDRAFFGPFFREKYGAGGDKALQNSRIRYYGPLQPASHEGELAGRRYVHEFDTMTGCTRGWHEILDRMGNVRQIRPERRDGIVRHYRFDGSGRYRGSW
jgi:hypothetical protein